MLIRQHDRRFVPNPGRQRDRAISRGRSNGEGERSKTVREQVVRRRPEREHGSRRYWGSMPMRFGRVATCVAMGGESERRLQFLFLGQIAVSRVVAIDRNTWRKRWRVR